MKKLTISADKCLLGLFLLISSIFTGIGQAFGDDPKTLEIGSAAPDFNLKGIDDKMYSLKSFADANVLAIIFTCNHCPTAQAYEDRIKQLVTDYKSKGVAIVAVSPNDPESVRLDELGYSDMGDTFEEMKIRAKDKAYNFPYLYDGENEKMSMAYGPVATPHVFIFDKNRKLQYTGRIDDSEKPGTPKVHDTRNAIEALLAGKPVPVAKTKTFGCSIKWADKRDYAKKAYVDWAKEEVLLEMIDEKGLKELIKNDSDKWRLINVWATWCGPCVTEFPEFVDMNRMYRNREFEFISISADKPDKKDKALAFLKKSQASGKNYLFNSEDKYALIEAVDKNWQGALPYTLLVGPGGKIVYSKQGTINPLEMKRTIVEQLGRYY
ncbi:redoxin domain-containing protein [Rhodocytophaga aerolata]|uniref:Redoxin domain-containing protein n=1 Tax=Rhodocytophaga aerolata TaxID=455078 RepID=A0ABT8QYF8_9BACT|nr:redoxin domain-containing protein [Rhodocytophaga aerolata]MDO1444875.1 redoxin domain-containing protein [Rhodocytophaga aerolata]